MKSLKGSLGKQVVAEPLALHLDTSGASGLAGVVPWVNTLLLYSRYRS